MIKVAVIAVGGVILLGIIKSLKSNIAPFLVLAISGLIMIAIVGRLELVVNMLEKFESYTKIDKAYFGTLIKMMGIAYVSEFTAGICRDGGYQSIAGQVEILGKILIMCMSFPIIMTLLETITLFF